MTSAPPLRVVLLSLDTQNAARISVPLLRDEGISLELVVFPRRLTGHGRLGLALHLLARSGIGYLAWQLRRRLSAATRGPTLRDLLRRLRPGVPILDVASLHEPGAFDAVRRLAPDLILCVSCPEKLTPAQFGAARLGALNVHGSLLPAYRGVTPVLHALADGVSEHGASAHWLDEKLDTGPLIAQQAFPMDDVSDYQTAWERTAQAGAQVLAVALEKIHAGQVTARPQAGPGSYCSWPTRTTLRRARARGVRLN